MPIRHFFRSLPAFSVHPEHFQILQSAQSFREFLLNAIHNATQRIYISALYLENDEAGQEVLSALYQAKQENPNLDIAICVDWHRAQRGLIGADKSAGNAAFYQDYEQKHSVSIPVYGIPVRSREVFGVLHLKGFVIDDCVIYSGASLNNVYLHFQDRYRFDRYHVIHHGALADSMVSFMRQHMIDNPAVHNLSNNDLPCTKDIKPSIKRFRISLARAAYQVPANRTKENEVAITPLVGVGRRHNKLNQQIVSLLASAKEEIHLCTPYFNPPKVVIREIKRAIRRGVKVHIIVGDKTANDFYIPPDQPFKVIGGLPYLYEMTLRKFARMNEKNIKSGLLSIHLWKHDSNSYHLKGIWVDHTIMLLTGNNINPRAWALDLENGLLIRDENHQLKDQFMAEFDNIFRHTTRLTSFNEIETIQDYPHKIQRLLRKVIRTRADRLLKRIL